MKNTLLGLALLVLGCATTALGADKWLHVKVDGQGDEGEKVRVNVPLEVAEKVLPAINSHDLHDGKVKVHHADMNGVDLRAILNAVRDSKDNEFVTVQNRDEDVRVAKSDGKIVIHVRDSKAHANKNAEGKHPHQSVDVTIPMPVVEALFAPGQDELDLVGALRALSAYGDTTLVTVTDDSEQVRIWVDSQSGTPEER
jgi:hypothetical protein